MPSQPWKTLSSREVCQNPWIRVREDITEMPNGKTTIYGVCEEVAHVYMGRGLMAVEAVPDDTEFIKHALMPFDQALQTVIDSEIRDALTMLAVLLAARLRNNRS